MTDSDANASTRPISVAELLAKNGTIGAPPVGGRRRRRRGNADSVTVAELTGEIPIYREDTADRAPAPPTSPPKPTPVEEPVRTSAEPVEDPAGPPMAATIETGVEATAESTSESDVETEPRTDDAAPEDAPDVPPKSASEAEADYAAHLAQRNVDPDPIDFAPPSRRTRGAAPKTFSPFVKPASSGNTVKSTGTAVTASSTASSGFDLQAGGAEQMSPDPVIDDDELLDLGPDVDFDEVLDQQHASDVDDRSTRDYELPSYLRSNSDTLFGGQSVADDLARRGLRPGPEDIVLAADDAADADADRPGETGDSAEPGGSAFLRGVWVVVQCILAVAFGAGLFIAFDQLWGWNKIVALVLSVLVILGLVVGVRVVRKTEDIGSTLIAVAVGALVTLGPLALLQSH